MTLALANRKDAIKARLDETFPIGVGYGFFDVTLTRQAKDTPRAIKIAWVAYPFEADVADALGNLHAADVIFERRQLWTCGSFHVDEMKAWEAHEGSTYLTYEGHWSDELTLDEGTEADLRAGGETFESACAPGNYIACPTCGGGSRIMRDRKTFKFEPCSDCARLGLDRSAFYPGILNLDVPEHREFFESALAAALTAAREQAARESAKRDKALAQPAATAAPTWRPLPSRAGGLLNGMPVAPVAPGCDYLTHAEDPDRRLRCRNDARWFDPTTGLRVCASHKNRPHPTDTSPDTRKGAAR